MIYYDLFISKITGWDQEKNQILQTGLEDFFKNYTIIEYQNKHISFSAFILDFEFIFLKKNTECLFSKTEYLPKSPVRSNQTSSSSRFIFQNSKAHTSSIKHNKKKNQYNPKQQMEGSNIYLMGGVGGESVYGHTNSLPGGSVRLSSLRDMSLKMRRNIREKMLENEDNPMIFDFIIFYAKRFGCLILNYGLDSFKYIRF